MMDFTWRAATRVVFGAGQLSRVGAEAKKLGAGKVLLVTDATLHGMANVVGVAVDSLREAGAEVQVFDAIESDPSIEVVEAGTEMARGFAPDVVVAIGGGSVLDAAKVIDMLFICGDHVENHLSGGTVKQELLPIIAVPTTAGTGAEMSVGAVISDQRKKLKLVLSEWAYVPKVAILDPALTVGLPPKLTAATAMDAHAHAVDLLHSSRPQPWINALAHYAVRTVHDELPRVMADPENLDARGRLLAAASAMGIGLSVVPYGIIHALAHPLGAHFKLHHGVCVALLTPSGMRWNFESAKPVYAEAARAARLAGEAVSDDGAAGSLLDATEALLADLPLPQTLGEVGVGEGDLDDLSADATRDIGARFNLRRPDSPGELAEIYRGAL